MGYCLSVWDIVCQYEILSVNMGYCLSVWDIVCQYEILSVSMGYCMSVWDIVCQYGIKGLYQHVSNSEWLLIYVDILFYIFLTVHLGIIPVDNQLDAQFLQ
jgi:hypothetical protein